VNVPGKVIPPKLAAIVNKTVEFSCLSLTPVEWEFNNGPLPSNVFPIKDVHNGRIFRLKIVLVQEHNFGEYTCKGSADVYKFESNGILKVLG